jgi:hypothetical protein
MRDADQLLTVIKYQLAAKEARGSLARALATATSRAASSWRGDSWEKGTRLDGNEAVANLSLSPTEEGTILRGQGGWDRWREGERSPGNSTLPTGRVWGGAPELRSRAKPTARISAPTVAEAASLFVRLVLIAARLLA